MGRASRLKRQKARQKRNDQHLDDSSIRKAERLLRQLRQTTSGLDPDASHLFVVSPTDEDEDYEVQHKLSVIGDPEQPLGLFFPYDVSDGRIHEPGLKELYRFEELIEFAFVVVDRVNGTLTGEASQVQHLAIRLLTQSLTIQRLGQSPSMLVPQLGHAEETYDIVSAAVIFRTVLETYLNMFEVFFEPTSADEFEFQFCHWMLSGLVVLEKHKVDTSGIVDDSIRRYKSLRGMSEITEDDIQDAQRVVKVYRDRLMQTQMYRQCDSKTQKKLRQGRSMRGAVRVMQAAGFSKSFAETLYSYYSGFIHADGYTSFQNFSFTKQQRDMLMDSIMLYSMILVAKMVLHYEQKYSEATEECQSNTEIMNLVRSLAALTTDIPEQARSSQ